MNSPIETYLKTKMERDRMRDQLHALGAKLANFASALMHRPERCSFANTDIGLPAEVRSAAARRVRASSKNCTRPKAVTFTVSPGAMVAIASTL
jgi:hypothetical protein